MIIKYKTDSSKDKITPVDVIRETEKSVYLQPYKYQTLDGKDERRVDKVSSYDCYHDTWEAARDFLFVDAESKVRIARRSLELANAKLGNIKGMKQPQP